MRRRKVRPSPNDLVKGRAKKEVWSITIGMGDAQGRLPEDVCGGSALDSGVGLIHSMYGQ